MAAESRAFWVAAATSSDRQATTDVFGSSAQARVASATTGANKVRDRFLFATDLFLFTLSVFTAFSFNVALSNAARAHRRVLDIVFVSPSIKP